MSKRYARKRDEIDKLYKTKRWLKVREVIIARDFGMCQECKRRNTKRKGDIVHHIVESRDDLSKFWDENNLECICFACHNREHPDRAGGSKKKTTKNKIVKFYSTNETIR